MKDAWKQYHELVAKFTKNWEVRSDIEVRAVAYDRGIELRIAETDWSKKHPKLGTEPYRRWVSTGRRNVSTLRELALCILAACDYVEEVNPTWASKLMDIDPPDSFLSK